MGIFICDRVQENRAQRGTLRKNFLLHLQSCRHPVSELSKFYRCSWSRSHYNRLNRSLPSAWNNTFLRNRSIFSRYLRTPRCASFSCRWSYIYIYIMWTFVCHLYFDRYAFVIATVVDPVPNLTERNPLLPVLSNEIELFTALNTLLWVQLKLSDLPEFISIRVSGGGKLIRYLL